MYTHDLPEADVLGPFSHLKPLHTVCDIKVMYTSIYKFIKIQWYTWIQIAQWNCLTYCNSNTSVVWGTEASDNHRIIGNILTR